MPAALYFKPSWERLQDKIRTIAPDLVVAVLDEDGKITLDEKPVSIEQLQPEFFWIHSELFKSRQLKPYFQLMRDSASLRWLHTINTGLDKLPYLELVKRGVAVTNNHAQAIAIAEFVFGQVLARYQDVHDFKARQADRIWKHRGFRELSGSHWVIIGFGEIGQQLAIRLGAFGVRVTAVRRKQDTGGLADQVVSQNQLAQVLPAADVVVLACASNDSTRNMVNSAFLGQMKDNSMLVNIARGDLVVEADLKTALDAGRPDFAVLDVFNEEPPEQSSWVWEHPRVSLTPHTSNAGSGMRRRSEANFLENLRRMMTGEPLQNQVASSDIV